MILSSIFEQLANSSHPVAKALAKGEHFKVIAIGFKMGMVLKEHKTSLPAKLLVLQGSVAYQEGEIVKLLGRYDETAIPVNVPHSVTCTEDALCLLIQG